VLAATASAREVFLIMFLSSVFKVTHRPAQTSARRGRPGRMGIRTHEPGNGTSRARMGTQKTQEEQNNGERSRAAGMRRAEWCMVNALSSLLLCTDILAGICRSLCR